MPSQKPTRTRVPQFFLAMVFALAVPSGCDEDSSDTDTYDTETDSDSDSETGDTDDTETETPDAGESHGGISDPNGEIRDSTNCLQKPCEDD